MKRYLCHSLFGFMPCALLACTHDLEKLEPTVEDSSAWLPKDLGEACVECTKNMCREEVDACIADRLCHDTFTACYPPNPSCGVASARNYDLATCFLDRCASPCRLDESRYDCVGDYSWPRPARENATISFQVQADPFEGTAIESPVQIEVCSQLSNDCIPYSTIMTPTGVRARVRYEYNLIGQYTPYLRLSGPDLQTTMLFEDLPIPQDYFIPVPALSKSAYGFLMLGIGLSVDDTKGTLNATFFDCYTERGNGIHFELYQQGVPVVVEPPSAVYYFRGQTPVLAPGANETDTIGLGGFANIEPGIYEVVARLVSGDRVVGRASPVLVLPGAVTQVNVFPLSNLE